MRNDTGIKAIYKSKSTVFKPQELAAIWGISSYKYLKTRIGYYIKRGYLYRIAHGLYVKDKNSFDLWEAANKLRSPSYVSLETILAKNGLVFQKYSSIFLVSNFSKVIKTKIGEFVYRKVKEETLFNKNGIIDNGVYCVASVERAFLDAVYLYKDYHFDNLRLLDWGKVFELAPLYKSKTLLKRVGEYQRDA